MKKRKVTDEQLRAIDRLVKEGKSVDEMYPTVGLKFATLVKWKRAIEKEGLETLLNNTTNERDIVIDILYGLEIGGEIFIADDSGLNAGSLVSSMYRNGRRFSKIREEGGYRLVKRS